MVSVVSAQQLGNAELRNTDISRELALLQEEVTGLGTRVAVLEAGMFLQSCPREGVAGSNVAVSMPVLIVPSYRKQRACVGVR